MIIFANIREGGGLQCSVMSIISLELECIFDISTYIIRSNFWLNNRLALRQVTFAMNKQQIHGEMLLLELADIAALISKDWTYKEVFAAMLISFIMSITE